MREGKARHAYYYSTEGLFLYTIEDTHTIEPTLNALPTNHWENALKSSSFMLCLAQNHKKMQDMEAQKDGKTR